MKCPVGQVRRKKLPLPSSVSPKVNEDLLNIFCHIWQFRLYFFFFFPLDINELNLPKTCQMEFPDQDDLLNFKLIICPDEVDIFSSDVLEPGHD